MGENILIIKASELVTCSGFTAKAGREMADLHIIEDGAVVVGGGRITALGKTRDILGEIKEPFETIIDAGCPVALATDLNPGSAFTESIPLIFALATLQMGMTIEEAVSALTINAAAAIGCADRIGSIDVGKKGDLILLAFPSYRYLAYHTGSNSVEMVVKGGDIVYNKVHGTP